MNDLEPPEGLLNLHAIIFIINTARVEAKPGKQFAVLVWDEKSTGMGWWDIPLAVEVEKLGQLEIINPPSFEKEDTCLSMKGE